MEENTQWYPQSRSLFHRVLPTCPSYSVRLCYCCVHLTSSFVNETQILYILQYTAAVVKTSIQLRVRVVGSIKLGAIRAKLDKYTNEHRNQHLIRPTTRKSQVLVLLSTTFRYRWTNTSPLFVFLSFAFCLYPYSTSQLTCLSESSCVTTPGFLCQQNILI